MKTLTIILFFLLSIHCNAQIEANLSFNKTENKVELTVKNLSREKEYILFDLASGSLSGSKVVFSYGATREKFPLLYEWWTGLDDKPSLITLKPLETKRFVYNSVLKSRLIKELRFMKVEYKIIYFHAVVGEKIQSQYCKGEEVYDIGNS